MQILHDWESTKPDEDGNPLFDATVNLKLGYSILFTDNTSEAEDENGWAFKVLGKLTTSKKDSTMELTEFMKEVTTSKYWQYDGSGTTIPCKEDTAWVVSQNTFPITHASILKFFTDAYTTNKKPSDGTGVYRETQEVIKGRRLIFVQDIGATALVTSALGAAALLWSSLV